MAWLWPSAYADAVQVSDERKLSIASPIALLKACKNAAEISGMREAHVRDGAALVEFLCWLETQVTAAGGQPLNEVSVAARLEQFRAQNDKFVGLSFETISAVTLKPNQKR